MKDYVGPIELCRETGICLDTIYRWVWRGSLKAFKRNGKWRIPAGAERCRRCCVYRFYPWIRATTIHVPAKACPRPDRGRDGQKFLASGLFIGALTGAVITSCYPQIQEEMNRSRPRMRRKDMGIKGDLKGGGPC